MTLSDFQSRVEWVIGELERMHDRQYPLRSVPMDLVAEAVALECSGADHDDVDVLATLQPRQIAAALNAILKRNAFAPGTALYFSTDQSAFDVVSPWQASSYAPHDGVERLRDGG